MIHPPPTNSKNRLKSFCEVDYANYRLNVSAAGKRISMEILVGVGLHAWWPVALKRFVAFLKTKVSKKYIYRLCNVKRLESVISVALKTPLEITLGICIYKMSLLHRPDDYFGFTPSCPPAFYNKIAPINTVKNFRASSSCSNILNDKNIY